MHCGLVLRWILVANGKFTFNQRVIFLTLRKLALYMYGIYIYYCQWKFYFFFSPTLMSTFCHLLCVNGFSFVLLSFHPLCYIQVPFGPLAFMPGKLVHTNEVTALLGDNWFAKCSAKQAQKVVDHRMKCECVLEKTVSCLLLKRLNWSHFNEMNQHCPPLSSRGCCCIRSWQLGTEESQTETNLLLAEPLFTIKCWEKL